MNARPGTPAETAGIYWCTVCKTPARYEKGAELPPCPNKCSKCHWQLVKADEAVN